MAQTLTHKILSRHLVNDKITAGDQLQIDDLLEATKQSHKAKIINKTTSLEFAGKLAVSRTDSEILLSAGLLNYTRKKADERKNNNHFRHSQGQRR